MIAIVDYDMGNVGSIANMLKRIGTNAKITSDELELRGAKGVILPGVGAFDRGMENLAAKRLVSLLTEIAQGGKPIFGICLGMQLMTRRSEEGVLPGLGWFAADTRRLSVDSSLRIPHMGWNEVFPVRAHPIFDTQPVMPPRFYHVHSYRVVCDDPNDVLCETDYGGRFTSGIARGNLTGVQFHPEKSHKFGLDLFRRFVRSLSVEARE